MYAFLHGRKVKKWFLTMKLIMLLILAGLMQISAKVYSQTTKFNFRAVNKQVAEVLKEIEETSDFRFFYIREQVDVERKVTVRANGATVEQILEELFAGQGVSYKVLKDNLVLLGPNENIKDIESVSSQQKTVSGKVTDSNNQPLPGVTVILKGTTIGTVTNDEGKYSITQVSDNSTLQFSFVGMKTQEVMVAGENTISITMTEETIGLDEVVAIGYGTQKKNDLTGAISTVEQDRFNKGIVISPEQLLQGKVSGVNITSSSGEPGAAQSITIRGPGSIRSGNNPLYVIDGLPLSNDAVSPGGANMGFGSQTSKNPMNFINPNDIESIDVLKDASSAAIYGARGSNGVIIITTKSGKEGKSKVDYSSELSVSDIARKIELLSVDEFKDYLTSQGKTQYIESGSTDWQDEIFRTSFAHNHKLSLSHGTKFSNYYASLSYFDQEGIVNNSSMARYTGRLNTSHTLWDGKFKINMNLTASAIRDNGVPIGDNPDAGGNLISNALIINPTYPVKNADGTYFDKEGSYNPLALLDLYTDFTKTKRMLGNFDASLRIIKGLTYKLNIGIDNATSNRNMQTKPHHYSGISISPTGRVYISNLETENFLLDNLISYDFDIKNHIFNSMAGYSYQRFNYRGYGFGSGNFSTDDINAIYNPSIGSIVSMSNGDWPTGWARIDELQSFFGRVNYSYKSKYLFTATLRFDGSSRFGDNNKYGTFPSVSAGWRISEEGFLSGLYFLHSLKLRAGWGQTGNQEVPSKQTLASVYSGTGTGIGYALSGTTISPGIVFVRNANPNLKWEVVAQKDIGFDFGLFEGKLFGSVDYFNKITTDALLQVTVTDPMESAGGSTTWKNLSDTKIKNYGWEFDLNYQNKVGELKYTLGFNTTLLKNNIEGLQGIYYSGSLDGPGLTNERVLAYINGESIGSFLLPEFKGLDNNGLSVYAGADGSDKYASQVTSDDYKVVGSALPDIIYSFSGSSEYKNFDLTVNFNGVSGNEIYNNTSNAYFRRQLLNGGNNTAKKLLKDFPTESATNSDKPSTRYLEDGSYLRLNNLTFGFNYNKFKTSYVKNLRLYLTGQNLFVITKYSGYDPEVNTNKSMNGLTSYGIDLSSYPKAKTFLLGVNVTF